MDKNVRKVANICFPFVNKIGVSNSTLALTGRPGGHESQLKLLKVKPHPVTSTILGVDLSNLSVPKFVPILTTLNIMGKTAGGYYAVARGRSIGIYLTWDECKSQVNGFPNARYKKFPSKSDAESFIKENGAKLPPNINSNLNSNPELKKLFSSDVPDSHSHKNKYHPQVSSTTMSTMSNFRPSLPIHPRPQQRSTLLIDPLTRIPSTTSGVGVGTGRTFSTSSTLSKRSLKVTEDIVTGRKRIKLDPEANSGVDLSKFSVDDEGYVVVYTDGACSSNGRKVAKAGIGIWFGDGHELNISEPVAGRQTNNTAEIQAAERAILQAKSYGITKLKLMTDSQFTINCVTKWLKNWKRNGWKLSSGQDVKNRVDLEKLDKAVEHIEIKWSYVKGHGGIYGNEKADQLAVAGAQMSRK